jgi:signal transduction histidine kinase
MSEQTEGGAPWSGEDRRRSSWTTDWQSSVERDKAALARSLHDHSGGLLAAAIMDVTWSEIHLPPDAEAVRAKLVRARAALDVAIDLNRRMIEELRPTLLDNFGLVAALKWHFTGACEAAGIECHQQYPDPSPRLSSRSAIALYRIAQTILALMVGHESQQVDVALVVSGGSLSLQMESSRTPHDFALEDETTKDALSSVSSRIRSLGGSMALQRPPGGVAFKFELPPGAGS